MIVYKDVKTNTAKTKPDTIKETQSVQQAPQVEENKPTIDLPVEETAVNSNEIIKSLATEVEERQPDYEIEMKVDSTLIKLKEKRKLTIYEGQQGALASDGESSISDDQYLKSKPDVLEKTASLSPSRNPSALLSVKGSDRPTPVLSRI